MLDQVLLLFGEKPDYDLNLMKTDQSLVDLTASMLTGLSNAYRKFLPDLVLVQGDTSTAMAAAVAAFYARIPLGHVEAGLRSGDLKQPWPEEFNRVVIDSFADLLFAPTSDADANLSLEYNRKGQRYVTGNTGIDALFMAVELLRSDPKLQAEVAQRHQYLDGKRRLVLVTGHRRENFGEGFKLICRALLKLAMREDVQIVYPVHLNPNVRAPVLDSLHRDRNIHLIEPVSFLEMVYLMQRSHFILTDSGGIQEEAPALGKPVLVMRNTTERPEAVRLGTVKLVGTDPDLICQEAAVLLDDATAYRERARAVFPYGDGKAAERIINIILREFT